MRNLHRKTRSLIQHNVTIIDRVHEKGSISSENQCIRLKNIVTIYNLYTCISKMCILHEHTWMWRHCKLWRHRPLNGNYSTKRALNHRLSCIADTTKIGFQSSKQTVVTQGQVITVCRVMLLYEARVTNSLLGNHRPVYWNTVPDLWQGAWGSLPGSRTSKALT